MKHIASPTAERNANNRVTEQQSLVDGTRAKPAHTRCRRVVRELAATDVASTDGGWKDPPLAENPGRAARGTTAGCPPSLSPTTVPDEGTSLSQ